MAYPPNQVFIGNLKPDNLARVPQPWFEHPVEGASPSGPYGEIMDEAAFYGFTRACDEFDLFLLEEGFTSEVKARLQGHALTTAGDLKRLGRLGHGCPELPGAWEDVRNEVFACNWSSVSLDDC